MPTTDKQTRDYVATTFDTLARMAGVDRQTLLDMDATAFEAACERMTASHDTIPCGPPEECSR